MITQVIQGSTPVRLLGDIRVGNIMVNASPLSGPSAGTIWIGSDASLKPGLGIPLTPGSSTAITKQSQLWVCMDPATATQAILCINDQTDVVQNGTTATTVLNPSGGDAVYPNLLASWTNVVSTFAAPLMVDVHAYQALDFVGVLSTSQQPTLFVVWFDVNSKPVGQTWLTSGECWNTFPFSVRVNVKGYYAAFVTNVTPTSIASLYVYGLPEPCYQDVSYQCYPVQAQVDGYAVNPYFLGLGYHKVLNTVTTSQLLGQNSAGTGNISGLRGGKYVVQASWDKTATWYMYAVCGSREPGTVQYGSTLLNESNAGGYAVVLLSSNDPLAIPDIGNGTSYLEKLVTWPTFWYQNQVISGFNNLSCVYMNVLVAGTASPTISFDMSAHPADLAAA